MLCYITEDCLLIRLTILFTFLKTSGTPIPPPKTVVYVDLARYAGKWYEIASYPQRYQKDCTCTTAEYTASDAGYIIVKNSCNKGNVNGKRKSITGKAVVEKHSGNAKLKVQFFWPFWGKYWIIELADDYSYAVVSDPTRKNLWILARTPKLSDIVYHEIVSALRSKGFDVSKLNHTIQSVRY